MTSITVTDSPWSLGLVSNCWKVQLDSGIALDSLIAEAARRSLMVVELRQGSLGEYESGAMCVPQADRLADLARRFPDMRFSLAVCLSCVSGGRLREDPLFLAGRAAAISLANGDSPHLRLVDLQTQTELCSEELIEPAACGLVELTEAMIEVNGILSIEHARQPWPWFDSVMKGARRRLGHRSSRLRLCFDPCNLLLTERAADVEDIVASVEPENVSMIHVKQLANGQIQPDVGAGDLDWPALLNVLQQREHTAPVLFEVSPHRDVWSNLESAVARIFG